MQFSVIFYFFNSNELILTRHVKLVDFGVNLVIATVNYGHL